MLRLISVVFALVLGTQVHAVDLDAPFASIDGGPLVLSQWEGRPILVVNTASQCAFTRQYRGLQDLYDTYRDQGLVVVAVPSDDFNQELDSNAAVKDFCELQYGIDMPMTTITPVTGRNAHPFYASLREEVDFEPRWNFNKVLIGPDGSVAGTFGSTVRPTAQKLTREIEALLN